MNCASHGSQPAADPRIAFFDHHALTWDRTGLDPATTLRRLQELNGRLQLQAGRDVLEVGCGTGQITRWLADLVKPGKVVAADFSPAMLAQARGRGVDADFALMDICREEPVQRQFDVVLCFHSFPHFRDQATALRQVRRLIKPGGRLLVLHLAGSVPLNAFHQQVGGPVAQDRLPPAAEWPALLEPAGLRLVSAEDREDLFLVTAQVASGRGSGFGRS